MLYILADALLVCAVCRERFVSGYGFSRIDSVQKIGRALALRFAQVLMSPTSAPEGESFEMLMRQA